MREQLIERAAAELEYLDEDWQRAEVLHQLDEGDGRYVVYPGEWADECEVPGFDQVVEKATRYIIAYCRNEDDARRIARALNEIEERK